MEIKEKITINKMISFLEIRIETVQNHINHYKSFLQDKSYMYEELQMLKSIKDELLQNANK